MTSFQTWKRRKDKAQAFGSGSAAGSSTRVLPSSLAAAAAAAKTSCSASYRNQQQRSPPSPSLWSSRIPIRSSSSWTNTTGLGAVRGVGGSTSTTTTTTTTTITSTLQHMEGIESTSAGTMMMQQHQQQLVLDDDTSRRLEYQVKQLLIDRMDQCRVSDIVFLVLQPMATQLGKKQQQKSSTGNGYYQQRDIQQKPWQSQYHSILLDRLLARSNQRQLRQQQLRHLRQQQRERLIVRYQWANVIQRLLEDYPFHRTTQDVRSSSSSSSSNIDDTYPTPDRITSWRQAKEVLSEYIVFPVTSATDSMEWEHHSTNATTSTTKVADRDPIWDEYDKRLLETSLSSLKLEMTPSQRQWMQLEQECATSSQLDQQVSSSQHQHEQLERMQEEYEKRHTSDVLRKVEQELEEEDRRDEAQKLASELMRPLTDDEQRLVHEALYRPGNDDDVVAREGSDSVQKASMRKLQPGRWLNDEIIHYFCVMLSKRDVELCQQAQEQGLKRRRSHFFKSFFVTKLLNEGHADPAKDGEYEYKNVKRWSKNVPGKDIFELDKIVFPINVSGIHWVCAVIFMQDKKIQFYDSLGSDGMDYLEHLFHYVQDEHMDKKKSPLPDIDEWKLVPCQDDTPRQLNGYDCGVFTCMFADFVSNNCPLLFDQSHITQCRERIALSILNGRAIL